MPPTFDIRTYRKLETAMIRHLVKDWRRRSAPIFDAIATACRNRQWNEARRRVPELDLHDVGLDNKEWIKYFLHSFAVFGAGMVAKQRPSFVGVGAFETTLNQVAQNVVTYLELTATSQVQVQTLQLIAEDEAMATAPVKVAYDPAQPRDEQGQWTTGGGTAAPAFQDYEDAWAGGVADFGDPESAVAIQSHPNYTEYHDQLVAQLTQEHGEKITVYRAVSQDAYEGMEAGEDLGPMGVTTDPDVAKNWAKFAPNALKGAELRILKTTIDPRIAVMRGKEEESEIVVDGNEISFGDWEEIGRATDKGGFVPKKAREYLRVPAGSPGSHGGEFAKSLGDLEHFDREAYDQRQEAHDTHIAVQDYVSGNARSMNDHLRAGHIRHGEEDAVRLMDLRMSRNPLPADRLLTRTVATSALKGVNVGDVYQDLGYLSTTADHAMIDDIRIDLGVGVPEWHTTITIEAPKGLGHIDVNEELGKHDYDHQNEIILPRGTKLLVVSKEPRRLGMRVIP